VRIDQEAPRISTAESSQLFFSCLLADGDEDSFGDLVSIFRIVPTGGGLTCVFGLSRFHR
jgi:hypothetical protein